MGLVSEAMQIAYDLHNIVNFSQKADSRRSLLER